MEGIWKTLAAPIIASIIGGIVVGLVIARINRAETPDVVATSQSMDFPNPYYSASIDEAESIAKAVDAIFGPSDIRSFITATRFHSVIRLTRLEVSNDSGLRSKEIEVNAGTDGAILTSAHLTGGKPLSYRATLGPLDPNGNALFYVLNGMVSTYFSPPLLVLHDDARVEVASQTIPEEFAGLVGFLQAYPFFSLVAGVVSAVGGIFLIVGLPITVISQVSPSIRARLTTKAEAQKLLQFIDYLKKHDPQKLALNAGDGPPNEARGNQ